MTDSEAPKPVDEKRRADLREHQLKQCDRFWYVAAKLALAGDDRALRNRVEMYEAPTATLAASEVQNAKQLWPLR